MSTTLPPAVLRRALTEVFGSGPVYKHDEGMRAVAEKLEEAGYLIVARSEMHALRAAADRVMRHVPAVDPMGVWCGVSGCHLHGIREHGHEGGSPTPTRPR
jgi:hypothetical protein